MALECALDTFPDELLFACNASISPAPAIVIVNRKNAGGSGAGHDSGIGAGSRMNGSGSGVSGGGVVGSNSDIDGTDIGRDGDGVTSVSVTSSFPELKLLNFAPLLSRKGDTAENPGLATTGGGSSNR